MNEIELKNLDIYKLKTINIKHYESVIYVDENKLYKIIDPFFLKDGSREKIIEILNTLNIENTIVPLEKIIMTGKNKVFKGFSMNYYEDYDTLENVLKTQKISLDDRVDIIKKINETYRSILNYDYSFWDIKKTNILIKENNILFCDMDSIKKLSNTSLNKDRQRLLVESLKILLNISDKDLFSSKDYIKLFIKSEYLKQVIENYYTKKCDIEDFNIYLDENLDDIKLSLIKKITPTN